MWISGPGGCGKTILVASYLDDRKISCLWYQVDSGDQDPATFFHYLAQAAKRAFPKKKTTLPAFTQDFAQGLPAFSKWYFERLFDLLPPPSKAGNPRGNSSWSSTTSMKPRREAPCLKSSLTAFPGSPKGSG